jgi:pSer/pThr/pTyr-binding forkhead associated (FHA) protein
MSKLVISLDGVVIKEALISKEKTTLGRRPYNDIVIDNLAVSGEHALLHLVGSDVVIEDLNSTNGTYINGKALKKQQLSHSDIVEIGKYKIKFLATGAAESDRSLMVDRGGPVTVTASDFGLLSSPDQPEMPASIRVLNGAAAGREVLLTKEKTTLGKPGVQVAAIQKRGTSYVFSHLEGALRLSVNGVPVLGDGLPLRNGDVIELAGTRMQFING